MKLIQIINSDKCTLYVYQCEVCGHKLIADYETTDPVCPECSEWAEDVAEEMEETNDRTDNNRMSPN